MSHSCRRVYAVCALATISLPVGAQSSAPGWYTETRVTSKAVGERAATARPPADYTMRTWATKTAVRVEGGILVPGGAKDAYLVSRPVERRGYQVIPSQRTIRVLDNRAILAMSPVGLRMADSGGVTVKELGDGGMILGHKTSKRQITIELRMPGRPVAGGAPAMTSVQTIWVASDPNDPMVAADLAELGKMKAASDELLRLAKSSDPKDRARARQLGDSMFRVMKIDETARRYNARNDPRAVTITDTASRPKRP